MSLTININGLTLCHRGSGGVTHNTLPDVCKTPDKGIPKPFDNEAYSKDLANGTTTVFADGGNMIANFGSIFAKSSLDAGGMLMGIKSGTVLAEADFITHSFDVFFEGKAACRLTDKMWMNHRNTVNMSGLNQIDLAAREKLCPAICYCSNSIRAAASAGTASLSLEYWADMVLKVGGEPTAADVKTRIQQECVANQFSSGWPLYEPTKKNRDMLAEATYSMKTKPFTLLESSSEPQRTTYPGGPIAPMSPIKAMGRVGKGKLYSKGETFRPDFVKLADPSKEAFGDNVQRYIEIKFDNDELTPNQKIAKNLLKKDGEEEKFLIITEEECCGAERRSKEQRINEIVKQTADSARKAMGLFAPPGLPGKLPGF